MGNGEWGIRSQLCAYLVHERVEHPRFTVVVSADRHSTLRFQFSAFRFITGLEA